MKVHQINVVPKLPRLLKPLEVLSRNLWYSWNWDAIRLFMRLDQEVWEKSYHNPTAMLGMLPPEAFDAATKDDALIAELERVFARFNEQMSRHNWFARNYADQGDLQVAYFSMEYGLHESLPIYSGGLGILSGDHLKSSSDLGIPLVAVGLLYQKGYFRQQLNLDGWQQEYYPDNDWYKMPVTLERDSQGNPIEVSVDLIGKEIFARIWRVQVGRVPLYLLDTNLPKNPPEHRSITGQLYGGDRDMRIRQEIVLGVGGVRVLEALGHQPAVFHMNEGHSAFLAVERLRHLVLRHGFSLDEAKELVFATNVFTTHTPVPAGNEHFDPGLVRKYLEPMLEQIRMSWSEFHALGQEKRGISPTFCLTVLALKLSAFCNGVSKLHGHVSREMWKNLWPGLPEPEIPITSVTNGIHTRSWISHDLANLLGRYLGPKFIEQPEDPQTWKGIDRIPDGELWTIHEIRKERLIFFARQRLEDNLRRQGASLKSIQEAEEALNSSALTIGFARRFAKYKRGDLLFHDPERLLQILTNPERPVQIIYAGKAHPQDSAGKELIRRIVHYARDPRFRNHLVFLEDYDMAVARYMVQGVDVWLNNPRRPLEASGTSGMKAAANGAVNVSILDGWWDEAYCPEVGWAIGSGEVYQDPEEQDYVESRLLYNLLENEIVPLYYERDRNGLPRAWIKIMKSSMKKLGAFFNTHRMVQEYTERFYLPAHRAGKRLAKEGGALAKEIASWRKRLAKNWNRVAVRADGSLNDHEFRTGDRIPLTARVELGSIDPSDVTVQAIIGPLDGQFNIVEPCVQELELKHRENGVYIYSSEVPCQRGGRLGYTLRVLPHHKDLVHPLTPFLATWET